MNIEVGDKIRFSTELLKQIQDDSGQGKIVICHVWDIREGEVGEKVIVLRSIDTL